MGAVVLDEVAFFLVVAAFLLVDVLLLFVLLIIGDVVPLLLFGGDAPNVNEVADPLLVVGSDDAVVGLLMFNLDESKEKAGDGCCLDDESKENTAAGCFDSSFDLLLVAAAAVLLVTLLLSFDDDILICSILYLCKGVYLYSEFSKHNKRRCTL